MTYAYDVDRSNGSYGTLESNLGLTPADLLPPPLPENIRTLLLVTYVAIIVLSTAANLLVLIVIAANKVMKTITNMYLASLAVSDLLIADLNMPMQLMWRLNNEWTLGETWCKLQGYVQGVTIVSSILTLVAIAMDRYVTFFT